MTVRSPVRVCFCITDLDPGGAERALVEIVKRLDREVWEPFVAVISPPGALAKELEAAGIEVVSLHASRWSYVWAVWKLFLLLRKQRPAIVQSFLFHANIASRLAGFFARVPIRNSGVRVAERRFNMHRTLDWLTQALATKYVCVSRRVAEFSVQEGRIDETKVLVIPNGVDVKRFSNAPPTDLSKFGIPSHSKILLFVGRLDPQKGLEVLIAAWSRIVDEFPEWRLVIAGRGPSQNELMELVKDCEITGNVHLVGFVDEPAGLYRAADFFVLPSLWEGMPNAVLEAMAAGLPIVATDVEGIDELVQPERNGMVVPVGDGDSLADALKSMMNDEARRTAMGKTSQLICGESFTWDRSSRRYEELFQEQLRSRSIDARIEATD